MSAKHLLTKETFESVVAHLVNLEDRKEKILTEYFPDCTKEREEFITFFDEYLAHINNLIKNTTVGESPVQNFPFVTIGSVVEVKDVETEETEKLRIVIPFQSEVDVNDVSYISPVGKSLLLKKVGDVVEVKAPGGSFRYEIEAIKFP